MHAKKVKWMKKLISKKKQRIEVTPFAGCLDFPNVSQGQNFSVLIEWSERNSAKKLQYFHVYSVHFFFTSSHKISFINGTHNALPIAVAPMSPIWFEERFKSVSEEFI